MIWAQTSETGDYDDFKCYMVNYLSDYFDKYPQGCSLPTNMCISTMEYSTAATSTIATTELIGSTIILDSVVQVEVNNGFKMNVDTKPRPESRIYLSGLSLNGMQ